MATELDPHLAWEVEWKAAWLEYQRLAATLDTIAQGIAVARCDAIRAKIMGTPVCTPQGAAVQLRIAAEEQLDLRRWLPDLPAQLDHMAS